MLSRTWIAVVAVACQFQPERVDQAVEPRLDGDVSQAADSNVSHAADATIQWSDVIVVNEIAAGGVPDDWFEVMNRSFEDLDLSALYFTDDLAGAPTRAQFRPGTIVVARGHLQVVVTNAWPGFQLASDEELTLVAPDGVTVIDRVDWAQGDSPDGGSYGRMPDGSGLFQTLTSPTPGAPNSP